MRMLQNCLSTASLKDPLPELYVPSARAFSCCKILGNFTDMLIWGNSVLNQTQHWIKGCWNCLSTASSKDCLTTHQVLQKYHTIFDKENNIFSLLNLKKFNWIWILLIFSDKSSKSSKFLVACMQLCNQLCPLVSFSVGQSRLAFFCCSCPPACD